MLDTAVTARCTIHDHQLSSASSSTGCHVLMLRIDKELLTGSVQYRADVLDVEGRGGSTRFWQPEGLLTQRQAVQGSRNTQEDSQAARHATEGFLRVMLR